MVRSVSELMALGETGQIVLWGLRRDPLEELAVGDRLLVRPGQSVATDGNILEGRSALDESPIRRRRMGGGR